MRPINRFCLDHGLRLAGNPCISPDFCLDWATLRGRLLAGDPGVRALEHSRFAIAGGELHLAVDGDGDHAWILRGHEPRLVSSDSVALPDGTTAFPATWERLLTIKNLIQEHDPASTIFPTAAPQLGRSSLGVGARFTTLHWPAVEWVMAQLALPLTANQNSIPRELVYDTAAMLDGRLARVPFPFIGASVPEGHQGQSVEGMSHGAVLSKLATGFHLRRIPWGFNADHQPIGGAFDTREDRLVEGCLLASYITFDLSPELTVTATPADPAAWVATHVPAELRATVRTEVAAAGVDITDGELDRLLAQVMPAVRKMQVRDAKYAAARAAAFTTAAGRAYHRELSIDELPGLTTPGTLATMLALCRALGMAIRFVAPAFGFQKNFPFADQAELERRVSAAWAVCRHFGVAIGFHSGSGKSAENYRLVGRITGGALEIKTSGRYTYEMGVALAASPDAGDQALWRAWWAFTRDLAAASAFADDATERRFARQFIAQALAPGEEAVGEDAPCFAAPAALATALSALTPSPDHMFWFEYNFLFVLAAGGAPDKAALGDHGPAGYNQRARFYAVSATGRLGYARGVARYLLFLAETTGLATVADCARAEARLATYRTLDELLADIAPSATERAARA